jgi:hypothetical protein
MACTWPVGAVFENITEQISGNRFAFTNDRSGGGTGECPACARRQILNNAIIVSLDRRSQGTFYQWGLGPYQAAVAWTKILFRLSLLFAPFERH